MLSRLPLILLLLLMTALLACDGSTGGVRPAPATGDLTLQVAGLAQPAGVETATWEQLKRELSRVLELTGANRATAAAPLDAASSVPDLVLTPAVGGEAQVMFSYRCTGDYDQNGEVNINDLTPIGVHYHKTPAAADWAKAQTADGDVNGEINIADITPIGQNYQVKVQGFELETSTQASGGTWTAVSELPQSSGVEPAGGGFLLYSSTLAAPVDGNYYRVVPFEGAGASRTYGIPSVVVKYFSSLLPAPANLLASNGVYSDKIVLTWSKVPAATGYLVSRLSQGNVVATLGDVDTYTDTAVSGSDPYIYWVRATIGEQVSVFSQPATGTLAVAPPQLDPPANVTASDGAFTEHILITWTKPVDATGYRVFRDNQTNLIATLPDQAFFNDTGITDALPHTYWISATDALNESALSASDTGYLAGPESGTMVVLAWNDLGMHCMNQDFSELMILPPYNVLHAQVIDRSGGEPVIVTGGVTVSYQIPENTHSADKCNFWDYVNALLGVTLAPNIGLTGNGMAGTLTSLLGSEGRNDWSVTGIPITPINDWGVEDPYNLATVTVDQGGTITARTQAVVPVSWEISCDLCHGGGGVSPGTDILRQHDTLHGTTLEASKPVLCGNCHAQPELGLAGLGSLATLSSAMHTAHADRMAMAGLEVDCYACHPGIRTQCLRDVMYSASIRCNDCHGTMLDVGNPARAPWADLPKCSDCHMRTGFEFEQPGVLYRNSVGHNGVHCAACHGSPHAITPTIVADDNVQALKWQGHTGKIDDCAVCHSTPPGDPFNHTLGEGGGD